MSGAFQKIQGSPEMVSSSEDVFAHTPTLTSTLKGEWVEVIPANMSDSKEIQFDIAGSSVNCFDLAASYFQLQLKIVHDDGTNLDGTAGNIKVCPSDAFVGSLFKRVDFSINENLVESETNYPFRAYLETLLNYSKGAKSSKLKLTSGWHEDKNLAKNGSNLDAATLTERATPHAGSATQSFCFKLHLNMFNQQRLILPRNSIRIKFERAPANFSLMAETEDPTGGGKVEISKLSFFLRHTELNPAIMGSINKTLLAGNPALYPIQRVETKFFTIAQGTARDDRVIQVNGQLPVKVIVAFARQLAVNGQYDLNPFRFDHLDLTKIELTADGTKIERFEPNFTLNQFEREYFQGLAINHRATTDDETITPEEYKEGRVFYAFDLTNDLSEHGTHLLKTGPMELKVQFKAGIAHTVSMFVYAIKDDEIMIDVSKRISRVGDKVGS